MTSWFKRTKSPETQAVESETAKLEVAREERKTALTRLLDAIEKAPLDDALVGLTRDLGNSKKNGHL